MRLFVLSAAALALVLVTSVALAGDVPNVMTNQGVVRNEAGDVVNGTYKLTFKLYTAEQAGQLLWSEVLPGVTVENGVYNVLLGTVTPLPATLFEQNGTAWLGLTVEAEPELPRVRVTSTPYAFQARNALVAASAQDLSCTGCVKASMLAFDPVTQEELNTGNLAVKGVVTATAFVGDGSGLTGISSPQGTCAAGFMVKGITAQGALICEKVATVLGSIDGLSGGTITGDVSIVGALSVDGADVCTADANCGDELWQLACQKDQVPKWDGAMWTCSNFLQGYDTSKLPNDGLNEISNDLLYNQFTDQYASTTCPVQIPDNSPPGISDKIVVPNAGVAQDLTVSVNISNSDLSTVEVLLYAPDNTEYLLYSKNGPGQQLGTTYPVPTKPVSGDLSKWIGKNPVGTWTLLVKDTGWLNNGKDGQINSWSITVKTLSTKKVQVKGNLVVDGDITTAGSLNFSGNAVINGSLKVGTDTAACDDSKKGSLRVSGSVLQWCNGANWTFIGSNATYRWAVFSTYGQAHGQWYGGDSPALFGGVNPSNWTDGNYRPVHMSSDSDILRTIFTRSGPPIGTLKNAMVYADEWYSTSSTNGKVVLALFRVRNTTANPINWKVYWYRTAYGGWNEYAGIALNGVEVWQSSGADYGPGYNSNHDISIPANRTSTVIFSATTSSQSGTRSTFMAFYNNCLTLPAGLEFVDDLDTKPSGWDK